MIHLGTYGQALLPDASAALIQSLEPSPFITSSEPEGKTGDTISPEGSSNLVAAAAGGISDIGVMLKSMIRSCGCEAFQQKLE